VGEQKHEKAQQKREKAKRKQTNAMQSTTAKPKTSANTRNKATELAASARYRAPWHLYAKGINVPRTRAAPRQARKAMSSYDERRAVAKPPQETQHRREKAQQKHKKAQQKHEKAQQTHTEPMQTQVKHATGGPRGRQGAMVCARI
jgi:hypothetical protein